MACKEWAGACGIKHATYALRRQIVAVKVTNFRGKGGHRRVSTRRLQLDKWHDCHSLFLDMRQLGENVEVTPAEMEQMALASNKMPNLQCLHFIGGENWLLKGTSVEGVLGSLLAKHPVLLTLHMTHGLNLGELPKPHQPPLALPDLQHLVLAFDISEPVKRWWGQDRLFKAINELTGLKTLYIQSLKGMAFFFCDDECDLRGCKNLKCVAVHRVRFYVAVALPAGCLFQVISNPTQVPEGSDEILDSITGLMLSQRSACGLQWRDDSLLSFLPKMQNLKEWRIVLDKELLRMRFSAPSELRLNVNFQYLPSLEVLELGVEGDLAIYVHPQNRLKALVIIASGALHVSDSELAQHPYQPEESSWRSELCLLPIATSKKMYLQSGVAYSHDYKAARADSCAKDSRVGPRLLEYVVEEDCGRSARMPAEFQPRSLQECCCGACLECLVRAGVPLLCESASTCDGFEKHLGRHGMHSGASVL